jgi:hypothetical protein
VAAHGAFDPYGKGDVVVAVFPEGDILSVRWGTAIDREEGEVAYAERVG